MIARIIITIFTAGWTLPAWLGVSAYFSYLEAEIAQPLRGKEEINSFPHFGFMDQCATAAFIWLATVFAFWAWKLSGKKG